jgi:hypothetical protein
MINILTWPTPCGLLDVSHSEKRGIFRLDFRATGIYEKTPFWRTFGNGDVYVGDDFDFIYPVGTSDALLSGKPKSVKMISEGCARSAVKVTYEVTTNKSKHLVSIKIPEVRDAPEIRDEPTDARCKPKRINVTPTETKSAQTQHPDIWVSLMKLMQLILINVILVLGLSQLHTMINTSRGPREVRMPWLVAYILIGRIDEYPLALLIYCLMPRG